MTSIDSPAMQRKLARSERPLTVTLPVAMSVAACVREMPVSFTPARSSRSPDTSSVEKS